MQSKPHLVVPKQRLDSIGPFNRPASRSSSLKDKLFAKVAQPLQSRSKSSLGNNSGFGISVSTSSNLRPNSEDARHLSCNFSLPSQHSEPPALRPSIKIIPEIDALDCESRKDLWAVVEVSGSVTLGKTGSKCLDVVAVLDFSLNASAGCVQSACETVLHVAGALSHDDRLAVIASSQKHPTGSSSCTAGCIVRSLQIPDLAAIETDLRRAVECRIPTPRKDVDFSETLAAAFRLVGYPLESTTRSEQLGKLDNTDSRLEKWEQLSAKTRDVAPLVLIISPNHAKFCNVVGPLTAVPVHVVQPNLVPLKSEPTSQNGWMLAVSCLQRDTISTQQELNTLINHARTSTEFGELTQLDIEITAANGCSIKQTIGPYKVCSLRPGEVVSVGVLVDVPPLSGAEITTAMPLSRLERNDRLISQIESMLGSAMQDVLSVQISCRISTSPQQQLYLREHETWSLNRYDQTSDWLCRSKVDMARSREAFTILAFKRLMLTIARSLPHREVHTSLKNVVPKQGYHPDIGAAMELLLTEIQFLLDLETRRESSRSQLSNLTQDTTEQANKVSGSLEKLSVESVVCPYLVECGSERPKSRSSWEKLELDLDMVKENLSAPLNMLERAISPEGSVGSDATTIHHELEEAETEDSRFQDKARNIWKIMRKDSKSKRQERREASLALDGTGRSDARLEHIRQRALQSKRSIGADTLRSLSLDVDMARGDRPAPWL